jgi:hypothetical protein
MHKHESASSATSSSAVKDIFGGYLPPPPAAIMLTFGSKSVSDFILNWCVYELAAAPTSRRCMTRGRSFLKPSPRQRPLGDLSGTK